MIISHRHQFAYFRVPKTASTGIEMMLRICGGIDSRDICTPLPYFGLPGFNIPPAINYDPTDDRFVLTTHGTPEDAVGWGLMTVAQLQTYRMFAFVREPLDRYVSAMAHAFGPHLFEDQAIEHVKAGKSLKLLGRPTTKYFMNDGAPIPTEALDFDNIQTELHKMIQVIGGFAFPVIPKVNTSRGRDPDVPMMDYYDTETEQTIRTRYTEDIALYNTMKAA